MSAPSYGDVDNTLLRKIAEGVGQAAALPPADELQLVDNLSTDPAMLEQSDVLYPSQLAVKTRIEGHSILTYAATTDINFQAAPYRTLTLTGNVTFTSSNRAAAVSVTVRLIAGGSSRTLAFPAGWIFVGGVAPTSLSANKEAILTVTAFGTTENDVRAAYGAQV